MGSNGMSTAMNPEAIQRDWAGRVLDGRFTLREWLGGTERSGVFLTEAPGTPVRKAAIKLIRADSGEAETRLADWAATASLAHPHLMQMIATGRCDVDGVPLVYAVSEYAEEVLAEILPARALTADEAGEMLGPVIETLTWLHGQGFVHGHLKPSNILVVDDALKLSSDCLSAAGLRRAAEGIYSAPEAVAGTIGRAADVWSLGATLVEALTQRRPVWDGSAECEPKAATPLPEPFGRIARGCLQADPARRCTLDEVKGWLLGEAEAAKEAVAVPETKERGGFPAGLLVTALVVVAALGSWMYVRWRGTGAPLPAETAATETQQQAPGTPGAAQQKPSAGTAAAQRQGPTPTATPTDEQASPSAAAAAAPVQAGPAPVQAEPVPDAQVAMPATETKGSEGVAASGAVIERVMPEVLPKAQATIQGRLNVRVRVTVDAAGNVSDAAFESEGPSKYFANAALEAARKWKFRPASAAGQPAASAWILAFQFTQSGTEVTPTAAR